jgi:hypothetical protein
VDDAAFKRSPEVSEAPATDAPATLQEIAKVKRKAPAPKAKVEAAPAAEASGTRRVEFGKEATYNRHKQFTAFAYDGDNVTDRLEIKEFGGKYSVERSSLSITANVADRKYESVAGKTETLASGLTKAEAKQFAEAHLGGRPDPLKAMREGVPFEQAQLTGKVDKTGWTQNDAVTRDGLSVYTNGHILVVGERPKGFKPSESRPDNDAGTATQMSRFLNESGQKATQQITPAAAYRSNGQDLVVFDNKAAVDGKYLAHFKERFPDATFYARTSDGGNHAILVKSDGLDVGLIMPVRPKELPVSITQILKGKWKKAEAAPAPTGDDIAEITFRLSDNKTRLKHAREGIAEALRELTNGFGGLHDRKKMAAAAEKGRLERKVLDLQEAIKQDQSRLAKLKRASGEKTLKDMAKPKIKAAPSKYDERIVEQTAKIKALQQELKQNGKAPDIQKRLTYAKSHLDELKQWRDEELQK